MFPVITYKSIGLLIYKGNIEISYKKNSYAQTRLLLDN